MSMWKVDFLGRSGKKNVSNATFNKQPDITINEPHDSTMLTKDLTMRKGIGSHEVMKARCPSSVTQDRHRVAIAPKVLCINELIVINRIFNLNNL